MPTDYFMIHGLSPPLFGAAHAMPIRRAGDRIRVTAVRSIAALG